MNRKEIIQKQNDDYKASMTVNGELLDWYADYAGIKFPDWMSLHSRRCESFSRWCAEWGLYSLFSGNTDTYVQAGGGDPYDLLVADDSCIVYAEGKFRSFSAGTYTTDDISIHKSKIEELKGKTHLLVYTFLDGTVRLYRMKDGDDGGEWEHKATTADSNGREKKDITEQRLKFKPELILTGTTIEIPPLDGKTKWTKEQFKVLQHLPGNKLSGNY